jgi:hypothetical protein
MNKRTWIFIFDGKLAVVTWLPLLKMNLKLEPQQGVVKK